MDDTSRSVWLATLGDLPVDAETVFPETRGFFVRRANARRAKLLLRNADTLRRALHPSERIRYAALGMRYWFWELYFAGWAAYVHNQCLLVVTDRRLLMLQLTTRGNPGDLKNQLRLEQIRGTQPKAFLSFANPFTMLTADGGKVKLTRIPKRDRARLASLLPSGATAPRPPQAQSIEHLCPSCLKVVPGPVGTTLTCPEPACRIPFRDPEKAARLSAWIPGLGDLYLRHHLFGAGEFLGSTLMLGLALMLLVAAVAGGEPAGWLAAGIAVPLLVGIPRLIDYRLTLHMARKGLVPLALAPAPGAAARNLPSYPRWSPLLFAAGVAIAIAVPVLFTAELREDGRFHDATVAQVEAGRFDEGLAAYDALKAEGLVTEERRAELLRALFRAGDLEGADRIRSELEGSPVSEELVTHLNAQIEQEQAAFAGHQQGLEALLAGEDVAAWAKLDPALEYFRTIRRPHLPGTRAEARMHLAGELLVPPVDADTAALALRMAEEAGAEAPPAEAAAVRAALRSFGGDAAGVAAALAKAPDADLPVSFRILALEARARVAREAAERKAVAEGARALPASLSEEESLRVEALTGETRL
jgi:hypothetical protein